MQTGGIGFEHLAHLIPHAAEFGQDFLLCTLGVRWVIEAPVMAVHLPRKERACLVGVSADSDDSRNLAVKKGVHVLRRVSGNVDVDLLHHLDSKRVDEADWFRPRAVYIDDVAGGGAQDAFSHVAAAGIPGAENEDDGLHNGLRRVAQPYVDLTFYGLSADFPSES